MKDNMDLMERFGKGENTHINSVNLKKRWKLRQKTKTKPRQFRVADLVIRKAHPYQPENKLSPNWTVPFCVVEVLRNGAYRQETLEGGAIPRTWNAENLKFYFS